MFSVDRKTQLTGPPSQWETRQTGTVNPRVGIFLSPLNTNDGFYLPGMQEKQALELPIKFKFFTTCYNSKRLYFLEQKKKVAFCTY